MAVNPFLRGMTGGQMGIGRPSLAQMIAPATAPTPTVAGPTLAAAQLLNTAPTPTVVGPTVASAQPLNLAGLRRQVLAQAASPTAPTAPQSRQALLAKYGLAPTAPTPAPSIMQRLSSALPAAGTPEMAGLGAAGRTMMELSGWQKATEAPSLGQILARSAEAGIGAMEKRQALAEKKAQEEAAMLAAAEQQKYERAQAAKELALEERRVAEAERTDIDELFSGAERLGLKGQDAIDFVKNQLKKTTTPSSKLFAVNIPGEDTMYLRADDPSLDEYLGDKGKALGAVVTEAPKVVGTQSEVTPGLTKAAHAKMVEATFNAQNNIIKLENVNAAFEDEFLTLQGKAKRVWAELKDNLGTADPDDKAYIQAQTRWKTRAWNQVNDYIKAITGAQMSEAEAKRIMKSLPNPDDSLFAITSPTKYREALNTAIQDAKMAVARQEYFLKQGLKPEYYETSVPKEERLGTSGFDVIYRDKDGKVIETYDMPKIMDDYTDKIASKYERDEYSNLNDDQKIAMINQEVNSYFGLSKMPGQGI